MRKNEYASSGTAAENSPSKIVGESKTVAALDRAMNGFLDKKKVKQAIAASRRAGRNRQK